MLDDPACKDMRSKYAPLVRHPDYRKLRRHVLLVILAITAFLGLSSYLVLARADALLRSLYLGSLTNYSPILLIMGVLTAALWNDSSLLLLVVPILTFTLGALTGEARRHVLNVALSLFS